MRWDLFGLCAAVAATLGGSAARAALFITEWQYNGSEYVELTNIGGSPIDLTGWSFDDDSRTAGTVSLSSLGVVQPRQSVLITEESAAGFRTRWNLPSSIAILGGNSTNLGREDEINIFDAMGDLVDRLTYGDEINAPGSIRANGISGNPGSPADLGANTVANWVLASPGDAYGSYTAVTGGSVGSPGAYVPEPAGLALAAGALGLLAVRRRK